MAIEIRVPQAGESVTEAMVAAWNRQAGEWVAIDEPVVTLETDKATVDVPAPAAGVLVRILHQVGEVVRVGDVLAIEQSGAYGLSASPVKFISHPEPREAVWEGGAWRDASETTLNHWADDAPASAALAAAAN